MRLSCSRLYPTFFLAVAFGLCHPWGLVAAQRAIPDDNLSYPVLITLRSGGTGSGFYLNTGKAAYLGTAKHVFFDPATQKLRDVALDLLSYSKDPSDSTRNLFTLDLSVLQNGGNIKPHPSEDVAVIKVMSTGENLKPAAAGTNATLMFPVPGVTPREVAKGAVLDVALDTVKPFEQVPTGNDVILFGYPTSLGLQQLPQVDVRRPLLRKGIVAGTNPQNRSIILDCPSYPGNSGGPVVELDREAFRTHFTVIGVILQYVPFADVGHSNTLAIAILSNSGYSIAAPMDFVLGLVK
jgi:S1-C subfamily serine protease